MCFTCVQHGELHLAQMSAQHLIIVPDEVDTVFDFFKRAGKIVELQKLLRTGLTHERTHTGIYTALARLLCLYDAAQLLEFLHLHWAKIQRGVILPLCEQERLWAEVAYLQRCDDEHARALGTMLDHPARAWTHTDFVSSAQKTTVTDVIYSGVTFYADNHPELLPDYLLKLTERVSPDKVVLLLESAAQDSKVFIARDWLMSVQKHDTKILNNCINGMLVEEEDYEALRKSLELYRNFDRVGLCSTLVTHSLMELRRVASWIHAESGRHQDAVDIALKDKLYVDATHFAAASGDADVVHKLLDYFISNSLNECFAAALYTCYEHIQVCHHHPLQHASTHICFFKYFKTQNTARRCYGACLAPQTARHRHAVSLPSMFPTASTTTTHNPHRFSGSCGTSRSSTVANEMHQGTVLSCKDCRTLPWVHATLPRPVYARKAF